MCGIAGFVNPNGFYIDNAKHIGRVMGESIKHRGPDNSGLWYDQSYGVLLVHQRLSIVDLSKSANQPMTSASGRYVLCFNGEIYNHKELRSALGLLEKKSFWKGYSDTETILGCLDAYGFKTTLQKLVGMFAIALWDKETKELFLARDRIGEKPLYYGKNGDILFFASELKALRAHPDFNPIINREALSLYVKFNYIPQPYSIYNGIMKLAPGHYVKLSTNSKPKPFWTLNQTIENSKQNSFKGSEKDALDALEKSLLDSVGGQMQADVPLGAFLSGGVDSSLILALMQEQSSKPVQSFSIGVDNIQFNEAPFAKKVAKHLGTEHHELYINAKQAREVIPKLPKLYDEPFSDSSQIPTFLLSEMAQKHVKVSLSGDGGDEIFGGYNRYMLGHSIWPKIISMPKSLRKLLAGLIFSFSPTDWDKIMTPALYLAPQRFRHTKIGDSLHKTAHILNSSSIQEIYNFLISHWSIKENIVIGANNANTILDNENKIIEKLSYPEQMMFFDTLTYLPGDILVKLDRAAMGTSLETRTPFLDHRVIDLAWKLPLNMKIRNTEKKWCLKELLYKRVPKELIERPKMGFSVPIGDWLRGPLRDWAEHLLDEKKMKESGYFNTSEIQQKWHQHISKEYNWQHHLWDIIIFESWRKEEGL